MLIRFIILPPLSPMSARRRVRPSAVLNHFAMPRQNTDVVPGKAARLEQPSRLA
jgi:hypothetical protein